jgi:hypothetical protein
MNYKVVSLLAIILISNYASSAGEGFPGHTQHFKQTISLIDNYFVDVDEEYQASTKSAPDFETVKKGNFKCWVSENKFLYIYTLFDLLGQQEAVYECAFDGEVSQFLRNDKLVVMKGLHAEQPMAFQKNPIYLPYEYALLSLQKSNGAKTKYLFPLLSDLKAPSFWNILSQQTPIVTKDIAGRASFRSYKLKSIDPVLDINCEADSVIEFSIDSKSQFCSYWKKECIRKEGAKTMSIEFSVSEEGATDLGANQSLLYPKKYQIISKIDNQKYAVTVSTVKTIRINDVSFEQSFFIDPSKAKLIEDVDNRQIIEVPK